MDFFIIRKTLQIKLIKQTVLMKLFIPLGRNCSGTSSMATTLTFVVPQVANVSCTNFL